MKCYPAVDEIYVCETEPVDVFGQFDPEYFIESLENYCDIEVDVTDEELSELQAAVENVMNEWISKYSVGSNNFRIRDVMQVNIKRGNVDGKNI